MEERKRLDEKRHPVKEAKGFQEKIKALWYYYKVQVIVAGVLVLFIGYGVIDALTVAKEPMADFYVICMTQDELSNAQKSDLESQIKASFPIKVGNNPSVDFYYYIYSGDQEIQEEAGGNEGYNDTLKNSAVSTALYKKIVKTNAIYLYDEASLAAADSDEISVDLSEEYPGAAGVQGLSFYLKESRSFADSSLPNDLQLRIRKSDEVKGSNENYSWQLEAVRNLIEGTPARTDEQVKEADAVYERALAEYNNS